VFWKNNRNAGRLPLSERKVNSLYHSSQKRLFESFLCISSAVSYLHHNSIRHKDLKPSQILLSPNGLWLTDSSAMTVDSWKSGIGEKWSFQENLADIGFWVAPFRTAEDERVQCLADLVRQMMEWDVKCRPTIDEVISSLSQQRVGDDTLSCQFGSFLSSCCPPREDIHSLGELLF
jgi:serine/threonine protein kinase